MTTDPVPAITEADATGEIADIYADIRASLGIGVVNLIWRHLATIEGALPWVWTALKPLYVSGAAARESRALFEGLSLPEMPRFTDAALRIAGVPAADTATVIAILDSYNRGNSFNLITLSALSAAPSCEAPPGASVEPGITTPIPALPGLDHLNDDVRRIILALSEFGAKPGDRVIPSLYRHLAYWPGYLNLIWATIAPIHHDGRLETLISNAHDAGLRHAARLTNQIELGPPPPTASDARSSIDEFRRSAISRMVPVAMIIRRMMG